jgi:hypothetical protein
MKTLTVEQPQGDLAITLFRIASNPDMVQALHEVLGGFCHQCRNLLNSLRLSLYLANRDANASKLPQWPDLEGQYRSVEQLVDRLQAICRPMSLSLIRAPLSLVMRDREAAWTLAMSERDRSLQLVPPEGPDVGDFDPIRLADSLDAFVRWRAEVGEPAGQATLRWGVVDDWFELEWIEPTAETLQPAEVPSSGIDPLALPLLARVISAHGGTLSLQTCDGLHLGARWPLVARPI